MHHTFCNITLIALHAMAEPYENAHGIFRYFQSTDTYTVYYTQTLIWNAWQKHFSWMNSWLMYMHVHQIKNHNFCFDWHKHSQVDSLRRKKTHFFKCFFFFFNYYLTSFSSIQMYILTEVVSHLPSSLPGMTS